MWFLNLIAAMGSFTDVGNRVASLKLKLLKRFFVIFVAVELYDRIIILPAKSNEYLFPESECTQSIIK